MDLRPPDAPSDAGGALSRARDALAGIANTPRQRLTLVIILALAGILVIGVFAYLVLRRR